MTRIHLRNITWCGAMLAIFVLLQAWPAFSQGPPPAPKKPALYEFGAGYCHSCKVMKKVMAELKKTHGDQIEFRMVYAGKDKDLFKQYKIMLIPTQVFLNAEGKEVDRHMGALTKEEVLKKLKDLKLIQ